MIDLPVKNAYGRYAGMAVTGPLDGKFITAPSEFWRVNVLPERFADTFLSTLDPDKEPPSDTFVYKWIRGMQGETACDFWVPVDKDFSWALRQIFEGYSERGAEL